MLPLTTVKFRALRVALDAMVWSTLVELGDTVSLLPENGPLKFQSPAKLIAGFVEPLVGTAIVPAPLTEPLTVKVLWLYKQGFHQWLMKQQKQ